MIGPQSPSSKFGRLSLTIFYIQKFGLVLLYDSSCTCSHTLPTVQCPSSTNLGHCNFFLDHEGHKLIQCSLNAILVAPRCSSQHLPHFLFKFSIPFFPFPILFLTYCSSPEFTVSLRSQPQMQVPALSAAPSSLDSVPQLPSLSCSAFSSPSPWFSGCLAPEV